MKCRAHREGSAPRAFCSGKARGAPKIKIVAVADGGEKFLALGAFFCYNKGV